MERRKNMTRKILLALLCCSAGLSGCERLSEKDKMDMIAKCDTEARKKFKEQSERNSKGSYINVEVSTHYSFSDSQCYALEENVSYVALPDFKKRYFKYSLFEGLTKKELLTASCTVDEIKNTNECLEGGGYSTGILVNEIYEREKRTVRYKEGREMIEARMSKP